MQLPIFCFANTYLTDLPLPKMGVNDFSFFYRHMNRIRDKPTIINTFTKVGVWNRNVIYFTALVSILFFQYLSFLNFANPSPTPVTVSMVLQFLYVHKWQKRETNYPKYFDYS